MALTAPVFNIQSYSIHDGPGIRVTVFLKGCPLRCRWCANPESNLARPQLMFYAARCAACGRCIGVCPEKAIVPGTNKGKPCAFTLREKGVDCGRCAEVCPNGARELAGKEMTVQAVLDQVLKDKLFLDASGGGMTISGGECLAHPEFTEALLYAAKEAGLHTAAESCSFAPESVVDRAFRYLDLGLLDIKHMDSARHQELTGMPNGLILSNIRHIYHELKKAVIIRVPVIPGCNDSEENIAATARFVRDELGPEVPLHLLPYHRLGESKNESLGKKMDLSIEVPSDAHMEELRQLVEGFGLCCQVGG